MASPPVVGEVTRNSLMIMSEISFLLPDPRSPFPVPLPSARRLSPDGLLAREIPPR